MDIDADADTGTSTGHAWRKYDSFQWVKIIPTLDSKQFATEQL